MVARHAPGSDAKVEVLRNGKRQAFNVTLDELKDEPVRAEKASTPGATVPEGLGIEIGASPNQRGEVVVGRVVSGSPAEGKLQPGDVILEVNRSPVHRPEDVVGRVSGVRSGEPVLFKIQRDGKVRFAAVDRR